MCACLSVCVRRGNTTRSLSFRGSHHVHVYKTATSASPSVYSETNDALTAENSDMQKLKPHVQPAQLAPPRDGHESTLTLTHTHTHTLFVLVYTTEHIHVVGEECVNISSARLSECTARQHNSQYHCTQMRYGLLTRLQSHPHPHRKWRTKGRRRVRIVSGRPMDCGRRL